MSDAEGAVVRDAMPVPGWLEGRGGPPESYCQRQMVDAVRYLVAGAITWRAMPADFPAWDRVHAFFRRWRDRPARPPLPKARNGHHLTHRLSAPELHRSRCPPPRSPAWKHR
nr:transposase [Streptomyces canus]